jgi:hypothetical protein
LLDKIDDLLVLQMERNHMQLSDVTLVGFLCLGSIRCLSYVPQIIRIARDESGVSAISYTTWCTWTLAHLATAFYAELNLGDPYLAAVSCVYALGCFIVVLLTVIKRARYRKRKQPASLGTVPSVGMRHKHGIPARTPTPLDNCGLAERPATSGSFHFGAPANA